MEDGMDCYKVLNISSSASTADIKEAYRALGKPDHDTSADALADLNSRHRPFRTRFSHPLPSAVKKYHPDVDSSAGALKKFRQVKDASEVLLDDDLRRKHDVKLGYAGSGVGLGNDRGDYDPMRARAARQSRVSDEEFARRVKNVSHGFWGGRGAQGQQGRASWQDFAGSHGIGATDAEAQGRTGKFRGKVRGAYTPHASAGLGLDEREWQRMHFGDGLLEDHVRGKFGEEGVRRLRAQREREAAQGGSGPGADGWIHDEDGWGQFVGQQAAGAASGAGSTPGTQRFSREQQRGSEWAGRQAGARADWAGHAEGPDGHVRGSGRSATEMRMEAETGEGRGAGAGPQSAGGWGDAAGAGGGQGAGSTAWRRGQRVDFGAQPQAGASFHPGAAGRPAWMDPRGVSAMAGHARGSGHYRAQLDRMRAGRRQGLNLRSWKGLAQVGVWIGAGVLAYQGGMMVLSTIAGEDRQKSSGPLR